MIKAIFFDLDDTLLWDKKSVKQAFAATCTLAAEKFKISADQLEEAVRKEARALYATYETYPFTQMIGINPFEAMWATFDSDGEDFKKLKELAPEYQKEVWRRGLHALGIDDRNFAAELAKRFPVERKNNPFVFAESFSVLDRLKGQYKLLLLTNGCPALQNTKLTLTPELAPYFDHIVISGAFGKGKPDAAIFEHAVKLAEVKKAEVLMVGDNLKTDILGAKRAGITSIWLNREKIPCNEVEPAYEIHHLEEIFTILKTINAASY
ncbi:HAD family hydrolase [Bacillaceae bacterium Marseille-Q3522]|nr:HAD family hydrolase [Bacillaceae bacterium Marseille-Q3522]